MIYLTKDGETVDFICWIIYGQTEGVVEQVLKANPHLGNQPAILNAGIKINLPAIKENNVKRKMKLWG